MNSAAVTRFLAGLFLASWQTAPPNSQPTQPLLPNAERIESGQQQSPSGDTIAYRIRLLPLSSFPGLPPLVAAELTRRQCMIPQSFEARQP